MSRSASVNWLLLVLALLPGDPLGASKEQVSRVLVAERDGARLEIVMKEFDAALHRLTFEKHDGIDVLVRIDGNEYSGTDGSVPTVEIASVRLTIGSRRYRLPCRSFRTLFNPYLTSERDVDLKNTGNEVLFAWKGGDGAGAYSVLWRLDMDSLGVTRRLREFPEPNSEKEASYRLSLDEN